MLSILLAVTLLTGQAATVGAEPDNAAPYGHWENGPPADPGYFPIAVWLQNPSNAARYKEAGINLYVGLWRGPTAEQLETLRAAGMPVICGQNRRALAFRDDPIIVGWMHGDEPDNAQPLPDGKGYGPPIPPPKVVADYEGIRRNDPSRPVLLNLGQGVANDDWVGRGPNASLDDYPQYVQGADIVSFDVYPVADIRRPDGENYLWYVAKGVSRLVDWTGGKKTIWNCIECTHIHDPEHKATPAQVKAEVWMALIHGSRGLIYFVHEFQPRFQEAALLNDPEMLAAVTAINRQIHELAPVLNSPTVEGAVSVESTDPEVPIATMVKRHDGATYVFSVGMRNAPTRSTFALEGLPDGLAIEVLGEDRTLEIRDGKFSDDFAHYAVHLYRIAAP